MKPAESMSMPSDFLQQLGSLVSQGEVLISEHGYEEAAADNIGIDDIMKGIANGQVIEHYPEYHKGPCVLLLQKDKTGKPVHVLWGIPTGCSSPAVVITAYRPDPARWSADFIRRKPK